MTDVPSKPKSRKVVNTGDKYWVQRHRVGLRKPIIFSKKK